MMAKLQWRLSPLASASIPRAIIARNGNKGCTAANNTDQACQEQNTAIRVMSFPVGTLPS